MQVPQIVFVDGPTGVGKDYFIDNFVTAHAKVYPEARVKVIRAVDIVLAHGAQGEDRKYTAYETPLEVVQSVYQGHLELLDLVRAHCDAPRNKHDVIVVNRSFLSYWVYNWQTLSETLGNNMHEKTRQALAACDLNSYAREFKTRIRGLPVLFVTLSLPYIGHQEKLRVLIKRIQDRKDSRPMNENWISRLIDAYANAPKEFLDIFTFSTKKSSDDYNELMTEYFKVSKSIEESTQKLNCVNQDTQKPFSD